MIGSTTRAVVQFVSEGFGFRFSRENFTLKGSCLEDFYGVYKRVSTYTILDGLAVFGLVADIPA